MEIELTIKIEEGFAKVEMKNGINEFEYNGGRENFLFFLRNIKQDLHILCYTVNYSRELDNFEHKVKQDMILNYRR